MYVMDAHVFLFLKMGLWTHMFKKSLILDQTHTEYNVAMGKMKPATFC